MGIGRTLLSFVSPKVLGEETVKKQEDMYQQHVGMYPELEPHEHLAAVWLSRIRLNRVNIQDEEVQMLAFTETHLFACVPPPHCATALGLYIVYKEMPRVIERYQVFQDQYAELMQPVYEAEQNGTMHDLYKKFNPRMSEQMESQDSELP